MNLLIHRYLLYLLVVLAVLGHAIAQPQAPITWGTARLLINGPQGINVYNGVFAHGDTLVLGGTWYFGGEELPAVCVSGNNGQTFSPWHTFLTPDSADSYMTFAVTSIGLYCCGPVLNYARGLYRSTDLGQTWTAPAVSIPYLEIKEVRGDTIWCISWSWTGDSVRFTTDGGQSFSPAVGVNLNQQGIDDLSLSDSAMVIVSRAALPGYPYLTTYALTAPRPSGPFGGPVRLNPTCRETYSADVELDRSGTGMLISCARYYSFFPGDGAVFLSMTQDHGNTWSIPQAFEPFESGFSPLVSHVGNEWLAAWFDSTVTPPFSHWGARFTFSANNGRSWYPVQQAFGEDVSGGSLGPLELSEGRVRYYAHMLHWNGIFGQYYLQWEGQIQRDSLPPVIASALTMPVLMPADTTISFAAVAGDDDSLWQMQVVLLPPGQADSIVFPLAHQAESTYRAAWTVPNVSGEWNYYYRAEDMWENVSTWPASGGLPFDVQSEATPPVVLSPSSFSLSSYPNPFNSIATIRLEIPFGGRTLELKLYDVLGREAWSGTLPVLAGQMQVPLSADGLASGVYYLNANADHLRQTLKLVVLK